MLPPILIIEDEPAMAATLADTLKTQGFASEWCATGRAGLAPPAAAANASGGKFAVDEDGGVIRFRGAAPDLTRYEFRLLKELVAKPGRVFSRDQLMPVVSEDPGASLDRTVDAHVKTLRAKIRAIAPDEDPILTHCGLGYSPRAVR